MPLKKHTVANTRVTTLAKQVHAFAGLVRPATNGLPMKESISRDTISRHNLTNQAAKRRQRLHGGGQEAYGPTCISW